MKISHTVFGLLLFLVSVNVCLAEVLDRIILGETISETIHSVLAANASIESGALGQSSRRIGSEGAITFTLACDPAQQNYLTVKVWEIGRAHV